eukprot:CAMPEP_0168314388 /NCGR_PEP_ID=MMETSP0210-20121227/7609_1 /TAXON_ID=40633 /ORGANISM="Condylostoma magnum, Strain COL2" /LENGTH=142 /DNA_ID=CAMNT_0008281331 /DNA_START=1152 /DNA_END=1580 /DNA_ORIENTATION=+
MEPGEDNTQANILVSQFANTTFFLVPTIEKLIALFEKATGSEKGFLGYDEFLNLVNSKLPVNASLEDDRVTRRIFAVLDKDCDYYLNINEFIMGLSLLTRTNKEEQFKLVFKVFDADDDGTITLHELARILKLNTASIKSDD